MGKFFVGSIAMTLMALKQKFKYGLFIPRKVTRKPKEKDSVISDLFPIRSTGKWSTFFEVLNVPALLNGSFMVSERQKMKFVFFDSSGLVIGEKIISAPSKARETFELDETFFKRCSDAATFSVFHLDYECSTDIGESYIAERGYTGFKRNDLPIKAYVHGNLDAVGLSRDSLEMLGNAGVFPRIYQVQHPLAGSALYEFFIVNPCAKRVRLRFELRTENGKWRPIETFSLNPRGSRTIPVSVEGNEVKFIRVVSRLYLGRPVVFRNTESSLDVFHG
jgi:hypothetical protein